MLQITSHLIAIRLPLLLICCRRVVLQYLRYVSLSHNPPCRSPPSTLSSLHVARTPCSYSLVCSNQSLRASLTFTCATTRSKC
jgi:hypothetical protein